MAAICAISFLSSTGIAFERIYSTTASVPLSIPCLSCMGLAPAARFFRPSVTIAWASTVAVVVPSPATSFVRVAASLRSCAPIFSNGLSSEISFATVTPSWVTLGAPNFLSRATLRPLGPRVDLTASAKISMPFLSERRASSSNTSCFAIRFNLSLYYLANNRENVILFENKVFFAIQFKLCAAILSEQDTITFAYINRSAITIIQQTTAAYRNDCSFLRFLFCGIRYDNSALRDFFFC